MWFSDNAADWMFLAGVALLTVIVIRKWYSRYGRRGRKRARRLEERQAANPIEKKNSQPLLDAPPDLVRWQVEMHELARDLKGELDSKMAVLQALTKAARRESERLEELLDRTGTVAQSRPKP